MSTKKGKKNVAGWQKLEPTDPRQSNVKESEQPVAEKEQEASSDTAPTETNPAKEEQEEALPTDEKSPASQPGAGKYLSEGNTKTEHSQKKEQPQEIFGSGSHRRLFCAAGSHRTDYRHYLRCPGNRKFN